MPDSTGTTWSERLRGARTALGLSLAETAGRFRVRKATVAEWESGKYEPSGPAQVLIEHLEREAAGTGGGFMW